MAVDMMDNRQLTIKKQVQFTADSVDLKLALAVAILGFLFIRWVFFEWRGFGVSLFTILFCITMMVYFIKKDIFQMKPGLFWIGVVLLTGMSFGVYGNPGLRPWSGFFLICSAAYAVTAAAGRLVTGQTGSWFLTDGVQSLVRTPFRHMDLQMRTLTQFSGKTKTNHKQLGSFVLAIAITGLIFIIVVPLLLSADSGGFAKIVGGVIDQFSWFEDDAMGNVLNLILAVPVSFYFFGLLAGSYYWRDAEMLKLEKLESNYKDFRMIPQMTVFLTLGMVVLLYAVFIGSQLPYYFSAFSGKLPDGMEIYSEYARKGFFELVKIAMINLIILGFANALSAVEQVKKNVLKWLNALMAVMTLVFIITALSKMILYINAYGLSMKRLLPCVLMFWMVGIFIGIIIYQRRSFDLFRIGVISGVLMFCALLVANPDSLVVQYNANRYLAGTLNKFDVEMLYRARAGGISTAMTLRDATDDIRLKNELSTYLFDQSNVLSSTEGTLQDTLENVMARQKLLAVKKTP
ncbi:DUF4173 domain-containing protein [Fusibacter paucivorans]|uniref:DUF4173 domain-containing protein n=1 Tax=Fusibacter paucivorans TaxID=76009 RepID=A0ABS5PTF7_9FIRM|nr:DUF4173 domain-containing protein [Fusibacter paucivorans]MBS7527631.1 DUF4173 domain-containing protein [Fusibacter paucivorans]